MKPWSTKGIVGIRRFLEKVWNLKSFLSLDKERTEERFEISKKTLTLLHKTIKKVGEDVKAFKFNTAISQMMILVNALEKEEKISKEQYEKLLIILSPFAPHITEELWEGVGHKKSIFKESWPKYDPELIKDETINLIIQVNGKLRDSLEVSADISEEEAKEKALNSEKIKKWTEDHEIKKVIFVKGKLINIVVI
jgi:leucyl-tRNA synthetase